MEEKLTDILNEEVPLYEELLSLLQEEKRLLARRDRDDLHKLSGKIETLVFKAKALEKIRLSTVDALKSSFGLADTPGKLITLTEILTHVSPVHALPLKELQGKFLALASAIEELNRENSVIIGSGIENVKSAFHFLKEISSVQTYQSDGAIDAPPAMKGV